MKIAVGIIGMIIGLLVFLQSCTVSVGSSLAENEAMGQAGAVGVFIGFAFLIGGAFGFALPVVSMIVFSIAALFGFAAGADGEFADLTYWGGAAAVLATMSFFAWRSQRKAKQAATSANEGPQA